MMVGRKDSDCVFWGKYSKDGEACLPLVAHCVDVALTFRALVELAGFRRSLDEAAGRQLQSVDLDRLAVFAMLHDVGKANLGFQFKVLDSKAPRAGHVRELEPLFDDAELCRRFADAVDSDRLMRWSAEAESLLLASWSHHGRPVRFQGERTGPYFQAKNEWWRPRGKLDPIEAIGGITAAARNTFPGAYEGEGKPLPSSPRFHHRFAGLVMLADWLGSHPVYFPIEWVDVGQRTDHDRNVIPAMLAGMGLDVAALRPILAGRPSGFQERFGFAPRPLQSEVHKLDAHSPETRLVIAESETGSGKTEAAVDWFCKLFVAGLVDSLYFALPTRVAARELYGRIHAYVERLFPDPGDRPVTVLAVPGYAQVDGVRPENILPGDECRWQDDGEQRRRDRQWAAEHPKRFLAPPSPWAP